ncbi:MAG TPA: hypothetical protein VGL94_15880 [Ktedonobacteraceae bacterium]|jgi:hypothetical protein
MGIGSLSKPRRRVVKKLVFLVVFTFVVFAYVATPVFAAIGASENSDQQIIAQLQADNLQFFDLKGNSVKITDLQLGTKFKIQVGSQRLDAVAQGKGKALVTLPSGNEVIFQLDANNRRTVTPFPLVRASLLAKKGNKNKNKNKNDKNDKNNNK